MTNVLKIGADDNVAVALSDLAEGTLLETTDGPIDGIVTRAPIPFGHKVALETIAQGDSVIKYDASIGLATENIAPGQHVHVHNLRSVRGAARS
ncbi:MAG: UxaA family hydrolase [Anaerolineae bacterium]